jgi:hypothetical protein
MLSKKTVIVVGAGANYDFKFLTGAQLKDNIVQLLRSREFLPNFFSSDNDYVERAEYYQVAQKVICDALPLHESIDNFLHSLGEVPTFGDIIKRIGKVAIAACILKAEQDCRLFNPEEHFAKYKNEIEASWISRLARMLAEGRLAADRDKLFENLVIVTFNYDRCVEHFFEHAVRRQQGLHEAVADPISASLAIHHVYGSLGPLRSTAALTTSFGDASSHTVLRAASQIRTFTEKQHSPDIAVIQDHLHSAERIIFLGFAFHQLNLELIAPPIGVSPTVRAYATAFDQTGSDVREYQRRLRAWAPASANEMNCTIHMSDCSALFKEYAATWKGET